jgi:hypothetical protein
MKFSGTIINGLPAAAAVFGFIAAGVCLFIGFACVYLGLIDGHPIYLAGIVYTTGGIVIILSSRAILRRNRWRLALTGAILATILMPPLGIFTLTLTLLSRRIFS